LVDRAGGQTRQALALSGERLAIDILLHGSHYGLFQSHKMWRKASNCSMKWKKGVVPSEVTYSITITACGNGGQWSKALEL
jgi:hypothetical protein